MRVVAEWVRAGATGHLVLNVSACERHVVWRPLRLCLAGPGRKVPTATINNQETTLAVNVHDLEAPASAAPALLCHLVVIMEGSGRRERLTRYPATHHECMTMKSKFAPDRQARITVDEIPQTAMPPRVQETALCHSTRFATLQVSKHTTGAPK